MARIAVVGGTGNVGRTFVEALAKTDHKVFVFSRNARPSSQTNIEYIQVDYSSTPSLKSTLETHQIDTVISALNMIDDTALQVQLRLIAAADESHSTTRFIPSEYGIIVNPQTSAIDPYGKYILASAHALQQTKLQYTRIALGFFMDYWGMPHIASTLAPFTWGFDVEKGRAVIPGTGEDKVSLTYSKDLARFVVRLLGEEEWDEQTAVVGQDVTFHQALGWIEEATGRKFEVVYDGVEMMREGRATAVEGRFEESWLEGLYAAFGRLVVEGYLCLPNEKGFRLNERFPDLEVLTIEKMIKENWAKQ